VQQGVLMGLVEAVDLVDEEDRAASPAADYGRLVDRRPHVLNPGEDGRERKESRPGRPGD
jgi:hypothetical protein